MPDAGAADKGAKDKGKTDAHVVPTQSFCSTDKWCWSAPSPQGHDLNGVWRHSASSVFAVGERGTIMYYDGKRWQAMESNTTADLYGVWGTSLKDVHVVGENGATLRFDGHSWKKAKAVTPLTLFAVCGYSKSEAWAAGESGAIFRYDGKQWKFLFAMGKKALYGIWCGSGPRTIYAVGDGPTVIRGDGLKWDNLMTTPIKETLHGVHGSSPKDVHFVGKHGTHWRFDGKDWKDYYKANFNFDFNAVYSDGAGTVRVAAEGGRVVSYVSGISFATTLTTRAAFNAMSGAGADIFIVGDHGGLARNSGPKVTLMSKDHFKDLYAVWGTSAGEVFTVGKAGTRLRFDSKTWSVSPAAAGLDKTDLLGVWGSGGSSVFAVGTSSTILRYDGKGWKKEQSPYSTNTFFGVHGTSATDVLAVGSSGKLVHYNGSKWTPHNPAKTATYYGVWRGANNIYAVGMELLTVYQNNKWHAKDVYGLSFRGMWGDGAGKVYAVGSGGTKGAIYRANGTVWSQVGPTNTPFIGIWGNDPSNAYVVGADGAVARYTGGTSWVTQDSGTDRSFSGVWVGPKGTAFAVGGGGMILQRKP